MTNSIIGKYIGITDNSYIKCKTYPSAENISYNLYGNSYKIISDPFIDNYISVFSNGEEKHILYITVVDDAGIKWNVPYSPGNIRNEYFIPEIKRRNYFGF